MTIKLPLLPKGSYTLKQPTYKTLDTTHVQSYSGR